METEQAVISSKDQILKTFQQLLSHRKQIGSSIATKQESAEREEDKKVVEKASTYTIETIVKGLADLQLHFGNAVDNLSAQLAVEAPKLAELQRAIRVETHHLEELRNVRVAADALDILLQEQREKMKAFEEKSQQERQTLEREILETTQIWQKEQQEFDAALEARQAFVKNERAQQEADYQYEIDRQRKIAANEYANRKMMLERQIVEEETRREADWTEREQVLAGQQAMLKKYRLMIETFPKELEEAVLKAREDAVKDVSDEADVQAELAKKELAADKEVFELKIVALQDTIRNQNEQIDQLSVQLQQALQQAQDLAAKAVGGSGKSAMRG